MWLKMHIRLFYLIKKNGGYKLKNTFNLALDTNKYGRNKYNLELSLSNKKQFESFSFYFKFYQNAITGKYDLKEYFLDLEHDSYGIDSVFEYKDGYLFFSYDGNDYKYNLNNMSITNSDLNNFITNVLRYRFEIERYQTGKMEVLNV
jgi:hypothetical protein